jgi:hypothetical protein
LDAELKKKGVSREVAFKNSNLGKAAARHKYSVESASPLKPAFYFLISLAALASWLVEIFS